MKVILLKDVARIGRRGAIIEVPTGHALNFLMPRKMAEPATPENLKRQLERQSKQAQNVVATEASFEEALKKLSETPVELSAPANEQGHLFKGIKAIDISDRLKELGLVISPENIDLPQPIKALGAHEVALMSGMKRGVFTLTIIQKK